ncbi:NAD-binding Rossmann fold oxidoreductase [Anopheles sinensis]|uniref:NAD-binding Rossmann fold oxidoreductase n=1 Tax=Anopheles sinensis TaxID=74873 RepID=A0A084VIY1_ANOSI|nr:NAD-binding Rossmann fold oxidoreductase [Anopheles sinensis]
MQPSMHGFGAFVDISKQGAFLGRHVTTAKPTMTSPPVALAAGSLHALDVLNVYTIVLTPLHHSNGTAHGLASSPGRKPVPYARAKRMDGLIGIIAVTGKQ